MAITKKRAKSRASYPSFPLVYVEWEDHSGGGTWTPFDEAVQSNEDEYLCQSVGWLIAENKKRITIAASLGAANIKLKPDVAGQQTIAKALITKRITVRMP